MFVVNVFDAGRLFEMSELQQSGQTAILAMRRFVVNEQGEAFVKGQVVGVGLFELLLKGGSHPGEFKRA